MKAFLKGLFFGALLVLLNRLCYALFAELPLSAASVCSAFVFFIPVCLTLTGKNLTELFACGFTGVFVMFFAELCIDLSFLISDFYNGMLWLYAYIGGFWGSCAALAAAIFLTVKKISLFNFLQEVSGMTSEFSKNLKIRLLVYAVLTAMSFSYTVMPESSALGVPVFALIQFVLLWFTVPNRRRLFLYVPIFAMALNSFISASTIWHVPNFIISAILLAAMFTPLSFRGDSFAYISAVLGRAFSPFSAFPLPFKWVLELNSAKAPVLKRIALSLAIALPCAALLIFVLSNADMVFSLRTEGFLDALSGLISLRGAVIILGGVLAGLYLFGALCRSHASCPEAAPEKPARKGDLIIINTLLAVCLVVYTLFVIIQFKYLFAGSALPDGITYSDYARKGFFELFAIELINAFVIFAMNFFSKKSGEEKTFTYIREKVLKKKSLIWRLIHEKR